MPVANGVLPKLKCLSVLRTEWLEGVKYASRERITSTNILDFLLQIVWVLENFLFKTLRNRRIRSDFLACSSAVVLLLEVKPALL